MSENSSMPENANHSPRISFSQDFCHFDSIPIEPYPGFDIWRYPWGYSSDNFNFSISGDGISGESSWSAEELFYDGKILPTEIKKQPETINYRPAQKKPEEYKTGLPKPEINPIGDFRPVPEIEEIGGQEDEVKLPLLRNNSTDSNAKQKQRFGKQTETVKLEGSSSTSSSLNDSFQKSPLKKNHGGYSYSGNGGFIKVNSFLDMVPSGNLFGLESINFGSGSIKKKWKSMFFYR